MTLAELTSMPIGGNFYADQHIFDAQSEFMYDPTTSLADKRASIDWLLTEVMGCDPTDPTSGDRVVVLKTMMEELEMLGDDAPDAWWQEAARLMP